MWPGFIDLLGNFRWFHDFFDMKTWNLRWFHETRKSNKLKPEVSAPGWVRGPGRRLQPDLPPKYLWFQFFDFRVSWIPPKAGAEYLRFQFFDFGVTWIPPKVFKFSCQNIREYQTKFPNNSMKSRTQNKKNMRGFYWNPALVIFCQKYSCNFL